MSSEGFDPSASGSGSEAAEAADPMIGQTIDKRYRLTSKLGEGGMGEVYAAEHLRINRRVAIKLLRAEVMTNDEAVARFEQEAMTASSIGHECIIRIEDSGKLEDGRIYLAMELLDGMPFNDMIDLPTPVSQDRLLNILIQTGHGLAAAHSKGIVHRDMKPENIYVTRKKDGTDLPKLLDFGIAKVSQGEGENHLTRTGTIFGTPFYMAPEQALGQTVDHRADIYAMGVIMYEVFCGVVPFEGESFMGILTQHITAEPKAPAVTAAENGKQLLPGLEEIILKAMKKDPDERYQRMDDLVQALVPLYRSVAGAGMSTYMEAHTPSRSATIAAAVPPPSGGFPGHQTGPAGGYPPSGPHPGHPGAMTPMPSHRDEHSQPYIPMPGPGSAPYAAHPGATSSVVYPQRKSKAGLFILLFVVLAAAGGGAAFFLMSQDKDDGQAVASSNGTSDANGTADASAGADPNAAGDPNANGGATADAGADPNATTDPNSQQGGVDAGSGSEVDPSHPEDPPAVKEITVLVNSKPPGAKVFRGDKRLGKAPLIVKVNPKEPMALVLKAPRREDAVLVVDGSETKVTAVLERKGGSHSNTHNNDTTDNNNNNSTDNNNNATHTDPDPPKVDPCKKNPNLPECMLE